FRMHRGVCSAVRLIPRACFSSTAGVTPIPEDKPAPVVDTEPTITLHDAPKIKPAFNRKIHRIHSPKHMLQEEYLNAGDLTDGARLYDYKRTGEIAASIPSIADRINFVSPYERPWTKAERTWRREWHPALVAPRKAWAVPAIPGHFDVLNFYKYVTKTHVGHSSLDSFYEGLNLPMETYKELTLASMRANLTSTAFDSEEDRISAILAALVDDAITSLVHSRPELAEQRISYKSKSEAFWIRGGFSFLYETMTPDGEKHTHIWNNQKYAGDDRRKLGELAFVHRDELAVSVRSKTPVEPLLDGSEINDKFWQAEDKIESELYSPRVFNMWPDGEPLWQCPGYFVESDETHQHTRLAVKSMFGLQERIKDHWKCGDVESGVVLDECAIAQAVASTFAHLTAIAHTQGFTQYNDITAPLSTQFVLSDGKMFYFAVAQLNTLAINVELENFRNPRHNLLRIEGPFHVYDAVKDGKTLVKVGELKDDKGQPVMKEGLNEDVLDKVLQRLLHMVYKIK
ncbi:hypothetical protein PMAYCL1PPCAC_04966, partial [Pristionchus mayeri]